MGALANATALRSDPTFRDWVETAIVYQSRLVLMGDSGAPEGTTQTEKQLRYRLARDCAVQPRVLLDLCVTAIAANPSVAVKGSTAEQVTEGTILSEIANLWTGLASITYPTL